MPRLSAGSLVRHVELGSDLDAEAQYLFGHPRFVRADDRQRFYVADAASMTVRVYDRSGEYLHTVGGRGAGDDEFLDITCMTVTGEGGLVVVDMLGKALKAFSPGGELERFRAFDPEALLWPRQMRALGSRQLLFLFKWPAEGPPGSEARDEDLLFHLFDEDLQPVVSFGDWGDALSGSRRDAEHLFQIDPGNFWLRRDGTLLYAPWVYSGEIFEYEHKEGSWRPSGSLSGYVASERAFSVVDPADFETGELNVVVRGGRGRRGYILHNESRGVFELEDGRVVHFTAIEAAGERVFGLELFGQDATLQGYVPLESVPLAERGATNAPYFVDWKDFEDRFYVRYLGDPPEVRVVSFP